MNRYITYWKNFNNYKYLLSLLVAKNIKKKYRGSYLGVLWSFLNPLFHMIVLSIVFSTLFNRHIENFPVYLLCGSLLFQFFSTSTTQSMNSIIASANIIKKVYMPKYLATLATIISNFVSFLISIVVLAITMIATQANVTWYILLAPLYLVLFFFFVCGIGLIMATITVFFRDIEHIYGVLITMLSFASAIFYPAEIIPENYRFVLTYNPLFHFIDGFRDLVYVGTMPSALNIIICFSITIISIVAGVFAFVKYQDKFILYL